jgi:hypothetical protein
MAVAHKTNLKHQVTTSNHKQPPATIDTIMLNMDTSGLLPGQILSQACPPYPASHKQEPSARQAPARSVGKMQCMTKQITPPLPLQMLLLPPGHSMEQEAPLHTWLKVAGFEVKLCLRDLKPVMQRHPDGEGGSSGLPNRVKHRHFSITCVIVANTPGTAHIPLHALRTSLVAQGSPPVTCA